MSQELSEQDTRIEIILKSIAFMKKELAINQDFVEKFQKFCRDDKKQITRLEKELKKEEKPYPKSAEIQAELDMIGEEL